MTWESPFLTSLSLIVFPKLMQDGFGKSCRLVSLKVDTRPTLIQN